MIDSTPRDPPAPMAPSLHYERDPTGELFVARSMFKKHKVLPRPSRDHAYAASSFAYDAWPARASERDLASDPRDSGSLASVASTSSSHTLKHKPRRIHSGPDLPPTPPAHSRTSSGNQSVLPSSPTYVESPSKPGETAPPSTPPNQKSPPTPDVTPPQPASRPRAIRMPLGERAPSKSTTTDSRSESFKTAREDPFTSEDEPERAHVNFRAPSAKTSQSTIRRAGSPAETPHLVDQSRELNGQRDVKYQPVTPKPRSGPLTFEGEWRMNSSFTEVVQEWDDNLQRIVKVRKRHTQVEPVTPRIRNALNFHSAEDNPAAATDVTKAIRTLSRHRDRLDSEKRQEQEQKQQQQQQQQQQHQQRQRQTEGVIPDHEGPASAWSPSGSATTGDVRRFSGLSMKSTVSAVVEAVLVDPQVPQRRRTLRHVKKHKTLRDSNPSISPVSSAVNSSVALDEPRKRHYYSDHVADARRYSYTSTTTVHSIVSAKARRDVLKQGGIPVVIVPDRGSSWKPKEPSLRSTSSRRTRRSASLSSAPPSEAQAIGTPQPPAPGSHSSEDRGRVPQPPVDRTDERTIDYPPVVPKRTSSLSAPTSRNNSRAGSLTAESLKAHNALMESQTLKLALKKAESNQDVKIHQAGPGSEAAVMEEKPQAVDPPESQQPDPQQLPDVTVLPPPEADDEYHIHRLSVDPHGDPLFGKRLSIQNTPFSIASVDTCGTSHEVSQALAINIYPHQNTSVVMVDHGSSKPLNGVTDSERSLSVPESRSVGLQDILPQPRITATAPDSNEPLTPPQPQGPAADDADYSPFRNPRSPPEPPSGPPAIAFIPATPSGMTPAAERQVLLGNYFEEMEKKPKRSISLVRRALSRRRYSESAASSPLRPGFLVRSLSLSKAVRKVTEPNSSVAGKNQNEAEPMYPTEECPPANEHMLHPFWRPYSDDGSDDEEDRSYDGHPDDEEPYERIFRYPPIDNRPRRSFSQRLKKTFAVLPVQEPQSRISHAARNFDTDRRTIGRTASGNLRVIRRRGSLDSLRQSRNLYDHRPYTAPESPEPSPPSFWRGHSRTRVHVRENGVDETLDQLDMPPRRRLLPILSSKLGELQSLPRRLSERKREKRSQELRRKISSPKEVRDGVGDVIRRHSYRGYHHQQSHGRD